MGYQTINRAFGSEAKSFYVFTLLYRILMASNRASFPRQFFPKGVFNNYVDRICHFLTPLPLRGQILYPERGQKQRFFDPLQDF